MSEATSSTSIRVLPPIHTSEETAYVVDDYPYGFRLRCKIRYWIETTKHGQRECSQTTNPKRSGTVWNKPKKGTYSTLCAMYLTEDDHVHFAGISSTWCDDDKIARFLERFPEHCATEYGQKALFECRMINNANKHLVCTIVPGGYKTPEEEAEAKARSKEAQETALKMGYVEAKRQTEAGITQLSFCLTAFASWCLIWASMALLHL